MRNLVMQDIPLPTLKNDRVGRSIVGSSMSSVYLKLTADENGLGYSVFYYEQFMIGSARTKLIAVDGVEPTTETIRTRKYPYATEVFVVTRAGIDKDSSPAKLRDWLLSPEGQAVVLESGYVPLASETP